MTQRAIPLHSILNTGRFDFERAAPAPGWLKTMRDDPVPETEEYGIASTAYRARRPFHPERFHTFLRREWTNGRLLRSKGFFWLASKPELAGSWSQAGGLIRYGLAGRWWKYVPAEDWPQDQDSKSAIMRDWLQGIGDCRQELVFIGQDIDFELLRAELDACLLDDQEITLWPERSSSCSDPFGPW